MTLTPLVDPCTVGHMQGKIIIHAIIFICVMCTEECGSLPRQRMLLLWGKIDENILTDSWILDLDIETEHVSWTQVDFEVFNNH